MIKLIDILNEAEIPVTGTSGEKVAAFKPKQGDEAFERGYKKIKTSIDPETGTFTQEFEALPKFDDIRRNVLKYRREVQAFKYSSNEDIAKVAKDANAALYRAAQLILALDKMLELQRTKR
jgi:hypothetical protein